MAEIPSRNVTFSSRTIEEGDGDHDETSMFAFQVNYLCLSLSTASSLRSVPYFSRVHHSFTQ